MKKEIKLNPQPVKNEKLVIQVVNVDFSLSSPDFKALNPLNHISVRLTLSDGSIFERHFDFIPDYSIDKYVQLTISIFNEIQNDSVDKAK